MSVLRIFNRQKTRAIKLPLLRKITRALLNDLLAEDAYELAIHLVAAQEMAQVNWNFLKHKGSTDVITFNYSDAPGPRPSGRLKVNKSGNSENLERSASGSLKRPEVRVPLHGEIFICVDDAISQASEFRTNWQSEVVRYVVHGILHLQGFDDLQPAARRKMKREENRLVRLLEDRHNINSLG